MQSLQNLLNPALVEKIGWTLVHFIWQAAVIAAALAVVLRMLKKRSANLRYIISCASLIAILIFPLVTINMIETSAIKPPSAISNEEVEMPEITMERPVAEVKATAEITPAARSITLKERFTKATDASLPYLVSGWLIGVFGLSLWYLGGWAQLQKLRRQMVKQVSERVNLRLKHLADRMKIKSTISIMESALVQVPTIVGHFKPIILLPASALTGLSGEQIEAILSHELAHIKRCDYLVNIFQTVIEILGFYHPAVWWVSNKIRVERENCCDDIAVSICSNNLSYAKALATMEEMRSYKPGLAVAASGGNLFDRIGRLLGKESHNNKSFGWLPSILAIVLVILMIVPFILASNTNQETDEHINSNWNTKIESFDIDNANYDDILAHFGEPDSYIWGKKTFDKDNLPGRYIMVYPEDFQVFVMNGKIVEVRFEGPTDYVYGDGLVVGSSVSEALDVLGEPSEIVEGKENEFEEYVLYLDIDGTKGHGYYWWPDQNIRIWFGDDKVKAIYLTRSDYSDDRGGGLKKLGVSELLEGSYIDEKGHIIDDVNRPFVDDPQVIGGWKSVDFVSEIGDFDPGKKNWSGDLYLNHIIFEEGGNTAGKLYKWTNGFALYDNDTKTAEQYHIIEIDGTEYMFLEWKSGDYSFRHRKPSYYVLERVPVECLRYEPPLGDKAVIEENSYINEEGHLIDRTDYLFVSDPEVLGRWESVDFVKDIEDFYDDDKKRDKLFLVSMTFFDDGKVTFQYNKDDGIAESTDKWTKGLTLDEKMHQASKYVIKDIDGQTYMFYQWKSGDYTYRYKKPSYYVLKKVNEDLPKQPQILTTGYILVVPADLPILKEIVSEDNSKSIMITSTKLDEFVSSIGNSPEIKLLASPRILTLDGEESVISIGKEDSENGYIKLGFTTDVHTDKETVTSNIEFECRLIDGKNQTVSQVSTKVTTISNRAIAIEGNETHDGKIILLLIKPEILERPYSETGVEYREKHNSQLESAWREKFDEVYRLKDGQILKRIAPPFIPERMDYYTNEHNYQAESIPDGPQMMTFKWNEKLNNWGMGFGGVHNLTEPLELFGLKSYQYEGPEELLKVELPGDWIVRVDTTIEERMDALEQLLAEEVGKNIKFEKRIVNRNVIVASGTYEFHQSSGTYNNKSLHLYSDRLDPDEGAGGGTAHTVADLITALGDQVGIPVINETNANKEINIPYGHHRSSYLRRVKDKAEKMKKLDILLANLTKQTELQFRIERQPVEIWFVTE